VTGSRWHQTRLTSVCVSGVIRLWLLIDWSTGFTKPGL